MHQKQCFLWFYVKYTICTKTRDDQTLTTTAKRKCLRRKRSFTRDTYRNSSSFIHCFLSPVLCHFLLSQCFLTFPPSLPKTLLSFKDDGYIYWYLSYQDLNTFAATCFSWLFGRILVSLFFHTSWKIILISQTSGWLSPGDPQRFLGDTLSKTFMLR